MKKFRFAPLALAIVGALAILPSAQSEVPSAGDLDIYSGAASAGKGNAILFMIDTSSLGGIGQVERFAVMKKAIFDLMDNKQAFPPGTKVGVGMYPATSLQNEFAQGDGLTGGIYIPIKPLDDDHRQDIKDFISKIRLGVDEAPMASAYAEAGAYMMGTKTARLTYAADAVAGLPPELIQGAEDGTLPVYERALRSRSTGLLSKEWQYCPPEDRQYVIYRPATGTARVRKECPDDKWQTVSKNNVADVAWAGNEPDDSDVQKLEREGKRKFDLLWRAVENLPHGFAAKGDKFSPITLIEREWSFSDDKFNYDNPTESNPNGKDNGWDYSIDDTLKAESSLVPVLRYRALRQKYVGYNHRDKNGSLTPTRIWQYCAKNKAELVDYIYSSYRLMCNEKDWVDIGVYDRNGTIIKNATDENAKKLGIRWNHGYFPLITRGGRPHGISGRHNEDGKTWQFWYDPILNPYNGWAYYYDRDYKSQDYPPLPPTLNIGYSTSGIRNLPPEVRGFQRYTYDQPNYSLCPGVPDANGNLQLTSNSNNRSSTEVARSAAIYFFTFGEPRSAGLPPINEMNMSLTPAQENEIRPVGGGMVGKMERVGLIDVGSCKTNNLNGSFQLFNASNNHLNNHWGCMGEYSQRLNSTDKNPAHKKIKTAVFMITNNNGGQKRISNTKNCDNGANETTATAKTTYKNACLLGSDKYGGGGFAEVVAPNAFFNSSLWNIFYTDNSVLDKPEITTPATELAKSVVAVTEDLDDDKLGLIPTGSLVVPQDSFDTDSVHDFGYLPLMSPVPGSKAAQWQGNLRKYKQVNGAYVGKNSKSPYTNTANEILADSSQDYWASSPYKSNELKGGAFENIPMPASDTTDTPRNVYISQDTAGQLAPLSPDADKIRQLSVTGVPNQDLLRRLLLNYMGYTISDFTAATKTADITKTFSAGANKSLGGVFHSTPILLTARLDLDDTTKEYVPKKQYILFGAMDNAVHIVDDSNGKEVMSYFPREVLANNGQYKAITNELSATSSEASPSFGVDGPWTSYARYDKPDGESFANYRALVARELYAYGGARLGAKAYYGLDLSNIQQSSFKPRQLFTITPETTVNNKKVFNRLGYSWGQPVVTKIRWQGKPRLVVILTGGYDTYFDKTDDERQEEFKDGAKKTAYKNNGTLGNAVYIVDAKTGEPLIVTSNSSANLGGITASNSDSALVNAPNSSETANYNGKDAIIPVLNTNLKYSIPGSVKVLDRDADELTDHVYFADLNGQVFRLDIDNSVSKPSIEKGKVGTNPSVRVVRLAELAPAADKFGPRLYEAPVVTIQQHETTGDRFAVVNVASGDRSNPLWTPSSGDIKHNRVYAIYDKDVAKTSLFKLAPAALMTQNVKAGDLVDQPTKNSDSNFTKKGWSFPLDKAGAQSATTEKSNAIKAMGPMSAVGNKLYVAAYNPNDGRSDGTSCSAEVKGTSEALQFCLPYGYCEGSSSQTQRIQIGSGVLGIAFGGTGDDNKGRVLLTSNAATTSKDKDGNVVVTPPTNPSLNGAGPAFKQSYQFKPTLRPMGWYDLQSQRYGTTDSNE